MDITTKRVAELSDLPVKNPDGSPMLDENKNAITVTVFGPGSKIWQTAHAHRRRQGMKRAREAKGKFEAALDYAEEETIEFLCTVTKRFNGLTHPEGTDERSTVRAIYSDPSLGFIRDHMEEDVTAWENFTKPSATSLNSTSDSLPG